jgi:hypothetical protein
MAFLVPIPGPAVESVIEQKASLELCEIVAEEA